MNPELNELRRQRDEPLADAFFLTVDAGSQFIRLAPSREPKPWGEAEHLYRGANGQVTLIRIEPGGYSSIHLHEHKWNQFTLLSGRLDVRGFTDDNELGRVEVLGPSHRMTLVVPPGTRHQFWTPTGAVVVETYFTDDPVERPVRADDIVRFSENGVSKTPPKGLALVTPEQASQAGIIPALNPLGSYVKRARESGGA